MIFAKGVLIQVMRRRPILASGVAMLAACSNSVPTGQLAVVAVDTIVLEENESVFVGAPTGLAAAADGSFFVSDQRNGTIHQFDAAGRHVRSNGTRGRGPGEFASGPDMVVLMDHSRLAVTDGSVLKVIDIPTGKEQWQRVLSGQGWARVRAANSQRVFFTTINRSKFRTIGAVSSANDSIIYGGPFPLPLGSSSVLDECCGFGFVASRPGGDTIAVGNMSSDNVYVGTFAGPFDSIYVPPISRRGSLPNVRANVTSDNPMSALPLLNKQSAPWGLSFLPSGRIGYVHADLDMVSNSRWTGKLFLSIVEPRSRQACADAIIDVPVDPRPVAAFQGDTLLVLTQEVVENVVPGQSNTITAIRRFVTQEDHCVWASGT